MAKWKAVRELLMAKLMALGPVQETRTCHEFYEWVSTLMQVISEVIDVSILKGEHCLTRSGGGPPCSLQSGLRYIG